jgi:hypothetical protein
MNIRGRQPILRPGLVRKFNPRNWRTCRSVSCGIGHGQIVAQLRSKSDLQARPAYHRKRDSIKAHLTIVFATLAVNRWIEAQTGRTVREFVKTTRRYRTIEIQAGRQAITAAGPCPTTSARPSKPSTTPANSRTRMAQLRPKLTPNPKPDQTNQTSNSNPQACAQRLDRAKARGRERALKRPVWSSIHCRYSGLPSMIGRADIPGTSYG